MSKIEDLQYQFDRELDRELTRLRHIDGFVDPDLQKIDKVVETPFGFISLRCSCKICGAKSDSCGITASEGSIIIENSQVRCDSCDEIGTISNFDFVFAYTGAELADILIEYNDKYPRHPKDEGHKKRLNRLLNLGIQKKNKVKMHSYTMFLTKKVNPLFDQDGELFAANGRPLPIGYPTSKIGDREYYIHETRDAIKRWIPLFTRNEFNKTARDLSVGQIFFRTDLQRVKIALENMARRERFQIEYPPYYQFLKSYKNKNPFLLNMKRITLSHANFTEAQILGIEIALGDIYKDMDFRTSTPPEDKQPRRYESARLLVEVISCEKFKRPTYDQQSFEVLNRMVMRTDDGQIVKAPATKMEAAPGDRLRLMVNIAQRDGDMLIVNQLFRVDENGKIIRSKHNVSPPDITATQEDDAQSLEPS
jgi:hypothetical protein